MQLGLRVDRPVAEVLVAAAADGVEAFEREAEGIDPRDGSRRTARSLVCFSTSWRTVRPSVAASSSGSCGTSLGGRGSFSPSSTSLIQLPRRIGLVREAPDCFASVVAMAEDAAAAVLLARRRRAATRRPSTPGMP